MILQNIRVPIPGQCPDSRVYYTRSPEDISNFKKYEVLDLTSYYNCLSVNKWREYTEVKDIYLHLELNGEFIIEVLSNTSKILYKIESINEQNDIELTNIATGLISVRLTALSNGSAFIKGYFSTNNDRSRKIRLALNVCTYKRETYIQNKIKDFTASLYNFDKYYSDSVEMFIIDNAGALSDIKENEQIHIFKNRNLGGSGGYARGIYEIRKTGRFTHSVFVDDDTTLDFESVYRLYALLSYIKEEWRSSLIGGAMIRSESPTIIYETSATMTGNDEILNDNEVNVSDPISLLFLEEYKNSNYNGWWFCCTPHLNENDYPSPMFVAYDDVEYGARYDEPVITLNGIAVWHDSFDSKYSVARYYYDYRNMMIARAMTEQMSFKLLFKVLYHSALEALYMRYDNSDIFLRGLYDFFKGPEFIESLDPEQLNKELNKIGCLKPLTELPIKFDQELYEQSLSKKDEKRTYVRSILTLNGILLPSKGYAIAPLKIKKMSVFYRAEKVLHCDKNGEYGFVSMIDKKRALKRIFSIPFLFIKYSLKLKKVSKKYAEKSEYLHSEEFWKKYLGLN